MFCYACVYDMILFMHRIIQKLSDTLSLPNVVNINARRKSGFSEADALDWSEKNSSSVLQVICAVFCLLSRLCDSTVCQITCCRDGLSRMRYLIFLSLIVQGSLLPTSNMHLKLYTSAISNKRIQGRVVVLSEKGSYAAINEAISWRRVNPFSPLMDGKVINL